MASNSKSTTLTAPASSTYKYTLTASFNENWTSTNDNYSSITVTATLSASNISYSSTNGGTLTIYWHDNKNNTDVAVASSYISSCGMNYGSQSVSGTYNAYHNNDGWLSGYAYAYFTKNKTTSYIPASGGIATDWTALTYIPRQATMNTATNFTDETNPSFTFTNNGNATLSCWLEPKPNGDHLATRTLSGTSGTFTWDLTDEEKDQLRNKCTDSPSCTCRIGLYSTIGSNTWASYKDVTMTIVNADPTFEDSQLTYADTNDIVVEIATGDNQKIVRNESNLTVYLTAATAIKGATISRYEITFNGVTKSYTTLPSSIAFGVQDVTSNGAITATVYDSRGNSKTISKTVSVINYIPLTLSALFTRVQPTTGEVQVSYSGNFFNGNFGLKENELVVYYRYKVHSDESEYGDWIILDTAPSGNTYSGEQYLGDEFDYRTAYDFQIQAQDTFDRRGPVYQLVTKGVPVYWWDDDEFNVEVEAHANNGLYVKIGDESVSIGTALGETLYNDSTGTDGTVTLSSSAENYSYMEIYFRTSDGTEFTSSVKVTEPDGKYATLNYTIVSRDGTSVYIKTKSVYISGTSITNFGSRYAEIALSGSVSVDNSNYIYITKVVGYK